MDSLNLKAEQIGFADGLITGYEREKLRVTIVKIIYIMWVNNNFHLKGEINIY